jgi:hypothetical protein
MHALRYRCGIQRGIHGDITQAGRQTCHDRSIVVINAGIIIDRA